MTVQTDTSCFDGGLEDGDGEIVLIRFIDTGEGISEKIRDRIFNPFFTTRDRGTGLGLALVHNILRAHGGLVKVDGEVGKGTTLTIMLPHNRVTQ